MSLQGTRPVPPDVEGVERMRVKDNFVLAYLRYSQFKQTANPSKEVLDKYEGTVIFFSKQYYGKQLNLFKALGFEQEDLQNIARIWLCIFLGLHSKEYNSEKKEKYLKSISPEHAAKITDEDIDKIDRRNLNKYFNVQFYQLVQYGVRLSRNIDGSQKKDKHYIAKTVDYNKTVVDIHNDIYMKDKFDQITAVEYKRYVSMVKDVENKFDFIANNGLRVVKIVSWSEQFQADTLLDNGYWGSNQFQDTEEILIKQEEQYKRQIWLSKFQESTDKEKRKILRQFLKENTTNDPDDIANCATIKSFLNKMRNRSNRGDKNG